MQVVRFIGQVYWLLLPIILGGVGNMVFVKLPILKSWRVPMDGGKVLKDGKRLFGDNKTWKGFVGMAVLTSLFAGLVWQWNAAIAWPFLSGAGLGFSYVLFELPNSFVKRRLGLKAGTNGGIVQTFFDQADSVIGCALFLWATRAATWQAFLGFIVLGVFTHYVINLLLYFVKLKNQKG